MSIYEELLAAVWQDLPKGVRIAHSVPLVAKGEFVVMRGNRTASKLADWLGLPKANSSTHVRLVVEQDGARTHWQRNFDDCSYSTWQNLAASRMVERAGIAAYEFSVEPRGNGLFYRQTAFKVCGVKLPRSLSMHIWAKVDPWQDGWRVRVVIRAPFVGLLCRYAGNMRAE